MVRVVTAVEKETLFVLWGDAAGSSSESRVLREEAAVEAQDSLFTSGSPPLVGSGKGSKGYSLAPRQGCGFLFLQALHQSAHSILHYTPTLWFAAVVAHDLSSE